MNKMRRVSPMRPAALGLTALLFFVPACSEKPQEDFSLPSKESLYEYSIAVARRVRSLVPQERARALFNIGSVHERFGMNEKAVALFREGLEVNPVTIDVYLSLAEIYSLTNRGSEAIKACHMALRYDPAAKGAWTRIGQVLSHMQRHEEAIEAFRTEIRHETGDAWTHTNLGISCKALGLWKEAAAAYRAAIEAEPDRSEALYGLAEALRRLDQGEQADSYLERWKTIKKDQERKDLANRKNADNSGRQRQQKDAALTWLDAAELFTKEHNRAVNNSQRQARFLNLAGDAVEETLQLDPANRTAHIKRMDIVSKSGTAAELITATSQAANAMPDDPFFSLKLAEAHLRALTSGKGNPSIHAVAAQKAARKTLTLSPEHAEANGLLAEILINFGPKDASTLREVLTCAKNAVNYSKLPNATAYNLLARTYFGAGLLEEARETLEEGIRRLPAQDRVGREDLQKRLAQLKQRLPGNN